MLKAYSHSSTFLDNRKLWFVLLICLTCVCILYAMDIKHGVYRDYSISLYLFFSKNVVEIERNITFLN